jgi:hypothetical protein
MNKGFLVIAQNSEDIDYVRQAYALALSIKKTQSTYSSISLITNDQVSEKYLSVFDHIIPIPWKDHAEESVWKVENRWKFIHASPYDETIVLDTDMIVLDDLTSKWDLLSHHDIFFASSVKDYRGNIVSNELNRQVFVHNSLPNIYFGFHYFKKTPDAFDFYKTLEFIVNNWQTAYSKLTPKAKQRWVSMDVSAAIALKITGMDDVAVHPNLNLTFTHMKSNIQGWPSPYDSWLPACDYYFNDEFEFFINQFRQRGILHYVEDEFLTDEVITYLEKINE